MVSYPSPTWMYKPRSKLNEGGGDDPLLLGLTSTVRGGLRSIGGDAWQRRYVFIDTSSSSSSAVNNNNTSFFSSTSYSTAADGSGGGGASIAYGKGPTRVDKLIPLSTIKTVTSLSQHQMLDLKGVPPHLTHFGWAMSDGTKNVTWACETSEARDEWVRFLKEEIARNQQRQQHQQQGADTGVNNESMSPASSPTTAAAGKGGGTLSPRERLQSFAKKIATTASITKLLGGGGGGASAISARLNQNLSLVDSKPDLSKCRVEVLSTLDSSLQTSSPNTNANSSSVATPTSAALSNSPSYHVHLVRIADEAVLMMKPRSWDEAVQLVAMVRSIAPKMEFPPQPRKGGSGDAADTALVEARRQFIRTVCNNALANPSLLRLPELQTFVGFAEYSQEYERAMRSGSQSPKLRRADRNNASMYFGATARDANNNNNNNGSIANASMATTNSQLVSNGSIFFNQTNNNMSFINLNGSIGQPPPTPTHSSTNNNANSGTTATDFNPATEIAQLFRIMDEASAGYLPSEDIEPFMNALYTLPKRAMQQATTASSSSSSPSPPPPLSAKDNCKPFLSATAIAAAKAIVEKFSNDPHNGGTFSGLVFLNLVKEVSKATKVPIEQWVLQYKKNWYADIYKAFGASMGGSGSGSGGGAGSPAGALAMTMSFYSPPASPTEGGGASSSASPVKFDSNALLTLRYVISESGLRILTPSELKNYAKQQQALLSLSEKDPLAASFAAHPSSSPSSSSSGAVGLYTQTLDDFLDNMVILSEAITLEEMLTAMIKAKRSKIGHHSASFASSSLASSTASSLSSSSSSSLSLMRLINDKAGDQRYTHVSILLKAKIREQKERNQSHQQSASGGSAAGASTADGAVGSSSTAIGGKCVNCEATEARLRSLRAANDDLERENVGLNEALNEAEDELDEVTRMFEDKSLQYEMLKAELSSLKTELARAKGREETYAARLLAADTEVKRLTQIQAQQKAATEGDVTQHSTLYFLSPMSFGSSQSAPVVDLPGALVYNLPSTFKPLGLSMDVFLTGTAGNEYLSCRDGEGRRSIGWQLSVGGGVGGGGVADANNSNNPLPSSILKQQGGGASLTSSATAAAVGVLTVPGTLQTLSVPLRKWTRIQARVCWERQTFDLYLNGTAVMTRIPLRDALNALTSMGVHNRDASANYYGNEDVRGGGFNTFGATAAFGSSSSAIATPPADTSIDAGQSAAVSTKKSLKGQGRGTQQQSLKIITISVLDVYPRHDVVACYANMNFFSSEEGEAVGRDGGDGEEEEAEDEGGRSSSSASASSSSSSTSDDDTDDGRNAYM